MIRNSPEKVSGLSTNGRLARKRTSHAFFSSCVVKRIKIEITAKFRASRPLRCEDTKRIRSPEMRPKSHS